MIDGLLSYVLPVVGTAAAYYGARWLYVRWGYFFLNPVLVAIVVLIAVLEALGVDHATYDRGGRLIVPVGNAGGQDMMLIRKTPAGISRETLGMFSFVPLIGEHGWSK